LSDASKAAIKRLAEREEAFNWDPKHPEEHRSFDGHSVWVHEPPCMYCQNWQPRDVTDEFGKFQTVRCCMAKKMWPDFSCWKKKEKVKT
jgi:hypothetical protein